MDWSLVGIEERQPGEKRKRKSKGGTSGIYRASKNKKDDDEDDECPEIFVVCIFKKPRDDIGHVWYCRKLGYQFGRYNAYCWYGNTMKGSRCPFDKAEVLTDDNVDEFLHEMKMLIEYLYGTAKERSE